MMQWFKNQATNFQIVTKNVEDFVICNLNQYLVFRIYVLLDITGSLFKKNFIQTDSGSFAFSTYLCILCLKVMVDLSGHLHVKNLGGGLGHGCKVFAAQRLREFCFGTSDAFGVF